jgi:mannitol/fructose-specific phosphotransferase system IIA component (Ntr-type)
MNSLLEALQAGRLIELPEDRSKERALTILASLIEAVPTLPTGTDLTGAVLSREKTGSTALGNAWACPHARFPYEGDLVCAVGWSPVGIDYDAPDGRPVRIVVMYLVPSNQKNAYLKEVSSLAKALAAQGGGASWDTVRDLNQARTVLLDLVSAVLEAQGWRIVTRGSTSYQSERVVFDCIALRPGG